MRGAVFFDVDGTLVPRTSSAQHLAGFLGHYDELSRAEDAYAEGDLDNTEVSVLDARGWAGRRDAEVAQWLTEMPLVAGIEEVVAWCRERQLAPYLATLAWEPVGRFLCERFGFAMASGPVLAEKDGTYTGEVASHLDEYGKRDWALQRAEELGLAFSSCAAVGDSRSDLPLFECVGYSIAFNASPAVIETSRASFSGDDLRVILPALGEWLRGT